VAKFVLKASQVSQFLAIVAKEVGSEATLGKAIITMNGDPKRDVAVIFTDNFGNIDVKPV
jgi:hypothetical protein